MPATQLSLQNPNLPDIPNIQQLSAQQGGGSYLQAPIYAQGGQQALSTLLEMGGQKLANPTRGFQPFEEQARRQFTTSTIPSLAERFTAQGGGQRSSAFQGALGQAGSDLESQLAGLRSQYGTQQEQVGLNMLNAGLQPQYHQIYQPPQADTSGLLAEQGVGTGIDLVKAFLSAPGSSFKEKLGNVFGLGGAAAGAALEPLAQKAGEYAGAALAPGKLGSAEKLATATVPAVAGGTAAGLAGAPAAVAPAAAGTAATAVPAAAAVKPGIEAAIAPALAKFGAVAMPAAFATVLGYALYKGFLEPEPGPGQRDNPVAEGEYRTPEGNIVRSEGKKLREYDKDGKVIREQIYTGPPTKHTKYGSGYNIGKGAFKGINLMPVTGKGAK